MFSKNDPIRLQTFNDTQKGWYNWQSINSGLGCQNKWILLCLNHVCKKKKKTKVRYSLSV